MLEWILLFIFVLAGIQDYREGKVDNIFPGIMWVVLWFLGNHFFAVGLFGALVIVNRLSYYLFKGGAFGWADVLVMPVWFSAMTWYYGLPIATIACVLCWLVAGIVSYANRNKEKTYQPLVFYFAVVYVLFFVYHAILV